MFQLGFTVQRRTKRQLKTTILESLIVTGKLQPIARGLSKINKSCTIENTHFIITMLVSRKWYTLGQLN